MLHNPRKVFAIGAGITFGLGLGYVLAVMVTAPYPESVRILINQPNYSLFYLIIFPWAVGLFAVSIKPEVFDRKYIIGHISLAVILVLTLLIIHVDSQDKGPPHAPIQLRYATPNALQQAMDCAATQRKNVLDKTTAPTVALSEYTRCVAKNPGIDEGDVQRFHGVVDFLARGSLVAYADYICSLFSGIVVISYFWYLLFLRFTRQTVSPAMKDRLLLAYLLFVIWIPMRVYSLWYQGFYSIPDAGHSLLAVCFVAASSLVLLLLLFRPGPLMVMVAIAESILSFAVGIIGMTSPEYFRLLSETFDEMSLYSFLGMELAAALTLMAAVSPYFNFSGTFFGNRTTTQNQ
ncbi:MAG: hypothetical protein LGR52_10925 [Candidatus Thiosymbion ectosymbiont of Robbea hypermnestra]|nr:hypothetical protein [Candidatus Thiosymbion ectosymbiont of Robbea hypermnestra]